MKRVNFYIDGYNFYHLAIEPFLSHEGKCYRWLDWSKLGLRICNSFVDFNICKINFFTSPSSPSNTWSENQERYILALKSIPNLNVKLGRFSYNKHKFKLIKPLRFDVEIITIDPEPSYAEVIKREEKRTDVNIASHLIKDAYENTCDLAVIVTNDSDLAEAIKIAREKIEVVLATPTSVFYTDDRLSKIGFSSKSMYPGKIPDDLYKLTTRIKNPISLIHIYESYLKSCLFDEKVIHKIHGDISMPDTWGKNFISG